MTKAKKLDDNVAEVEVLTASEANFVVDDAQLYRTSTAINEAIKNVVKAGHSVQHEYQRILCSAMLHVATHKNIHIIRNVLDTVPAGTRKASMCAFVDMFAPVSFDDKGVAHYNKAKKLRLADAYKLPWWKAKKEETYTPFVLHTMLGKFLQRCEKHLLVAKPEEGDLISPEQVAALRKAYLAMPEVQAEKQAQAKAILEEAQEAAAKLVAA